MHGHHGHDHGRHHHTHAHAHQHNTGPSDKRYIIAIGLNAAFVALEIVAGFVANSTALFSDALHNLSDVLALVLAGGAAWLAERAGPEKRTYGYAKASVLAALANSLILVGACGAILLEAFQRLAAPEPLQPGLVMGVAFAGVVINGSTAFLFMRGRERDVNARAAFLHMAQDAAVSACVIVAGLLIWLTGASWIDPALSIALVAFIAYSSWGLLREAFDLSMDAAPAHINVAEVRRFLAEQDGVESVHDLHVWAMSAKETSLTAHLIRPKGADDDFLCALTAAIEKRFDISHVTVQIERAPLACGGKH